MEEHDARLYIERFARPIGITEGRITYPLLWVVQDVVKQGRMKNWPTAPDVAAIYEPISIERDAIRLVGDVDFFAIEGERHIHLKRTHYHQPIVRFADPQLLYPLPEGMFNPNDPSLETILNEPCLVAPYLDPLLLGA